MTQRYTRLGHSHNTHSNLESHAVAIKKHHTTPKKQEIVAIVPEKVGTTEISMQASQESVKNNTKEVRSSASPKRIIDPLLSVGNTAVSMIKAEVKKSDERSISTKKTFKEKAHRVAGFLNTVFKIVLFAVILAILVAIIIIIILT